MPASGTGNRAASSTRPDPDRRPAPSGAPAPSKRERREDRRFGRDAKARQIGRAIEAGLRIGRRHGPRRRFHRLSAFPGRDADDLPLARTAEPLERLDVEQPESTGAEEDGVAIGTVAARLAADPSQASRLVADTVAAGLLARQASARDGRRSVLRLTPEGEALIEATRRRKHALLLAHVEDWSDSELAEFARLLKRFSTIARG